MRITLNLASTSGSLKITPADYAALQKAVLAAVKKYPKAYEQYKQQGLSDMRYNWDMVRASGFDVTTLYHYLNDDHINAALAKILKNSGKAARTAK